MLKRSDYFFLRYQFSPPFSFLCADPAGTDIIPVRIVKWAEAKRQWSLSSAKTWNTTNFYSCQIIPLHCSKPPWTAHLTSNESHCTYCDLVSGLTSSFSTLSLPCHTAPPWYLHKPPVAEPLLPGSGIQSPRYSPRLSSPFSHISSEGPSLERQVSYVPLSHLLCIYSLFLISDILLSFLKFSSSILCPLPITCYCCYLGCSWGLWFKEVNYLPSSG